MNELSNEVKAKETHESALFYYNRAEFNLYKSTIEIKRIRERRYYKELGYSNFDDYCKDNWGVGRQTMDERIHIANKLSEEDFASYNLQYGHNKTLLLTRMEDEQREQATEKGIPTDEGYKSIGEATQKEINEYKRNVEEAERRAEQAEKQAEQAKKSEEIALRKLEDEQSKEPEVIEREVIKEVDNTDYERIKKLERQIESMKLSNEDFSQKEKEVKLLQLDASKSVLNTKIKIDEFLQEVAVTSYRRGAIATSSDGTKSKLREGIDDLKNFIKEMELALDGTIEH